MTDALLKKNHVSVRGNATKTMMFVHGYGCDQNMWRFITPAFQDKYRLVLLDLVGCGNSDASAYDREKYSSLQGHADDLIELCDGLNLKNIVLVGHSVSAMIGCLAAIARPALFDHLIMIGPSPRYINDDGYFGGFTRQAIEEMLEVVDANYLGWSSAMAPVIMGHPDRPELAEELKVSFCRNDPEIARHFGHVTFLGDNRQDLPKLQTKTLVCQSKVDAIAPVEVGEYVHRQVPNSSLVIMDTVGHCPHLSDPELTIATIQGYLSSVA